MKVHVDAERCQGHGRCYMLVPELFQDDEFGHGEARGDGTVPDELVGQARRAVSACPEFAITLTND